MPKFHKIDETRDDMFVTGSVSCDTKKTRDAFRKHTLTIIRAYDLLKTKFKIDAKCKLFVRNLRNAHGQYRHASHEIIVDIRNSDIQNIVSTMIHEFTHAQQYQKGDLKRHKTNSKLMLWKNKEVKQVSHLKDFEGYLNLPWEIEARKYEKKMIKKVCEELNLDFSPELAEVKAKDKD